jgi:hypothetical protein
MADNRSKAIERNESGFPLAEVVFKAISQPLRLCGLDEIERIMRLYLNYKHPALRR